MDFLELYSIVKYLPIKEVLEKTGVKFYGSGINLQAISPFRPNSKLGSFNINTNMNIFHDWHFDYCGGPIKFYQLYYNLDFKDAVKKLGVDFGIAEFHGRVTKHIKSILVKKPIEKPLDLDLMSNVYNIFLNLITLSDEDRAYLKSRKFDDKEIDIIKFKTFPRRNITLRKTLENKIKEQYGNVEVLFDVPGFFRREGELFNFPHYDGIIIPCYNYKKQIVGLQIRNRDKNTNKKIGKYIWFSSTRCLTTNSFKSERNGIGPGSPIGVYYTNNNKAKDIFITEGFFKAYCIEKTFKRPACIIQGINNWRVQVIDTLTNVCKRYPIKRIIIAYDSDMCFNINVLRQVALMGTEIKNKLNINTSVLMWKYQENYKGIDDLIYNNADYLKTLYTIPIDKFKNNSEKIISQVNKYKEPTKDEIKVIFDSIY